MPATVSIWCRGWSSERTAVRHYARRLRCAARQGGGRGGTRARLPAAHSRRPDQQLHHRLRRRSLGRGAASGCGNREGGLPRPARRTDSAQGRVLHRRHRHHLRFANARRVRLALRRHGGGTPCGCWGRDPRQDQHGRVRDGLVQRNQPFRPGRQPVERRAGAWRFFGRFRGGGGGWGWLRQRPVRIPAVRYGNRPRSAASPV